MPRLSGHHARHTTPDELDLTSTIRRDQWHGTWPPLTHHQQKQWHEGGILGFRPAFARLQCGHGLTIHGDCHSLLAPADVAPFVDTMVLPVACGRSKPSPAWHRSVGQACVWPIRPAQLGIPAGHTGCYACRSQHSQHHPRMYGTSHSSFAATTATFRLRDKQAFQSADCRSRMPCVRTLARRG
jgi:hypothetical protein